MPITVNCSCGKTFNVHDDRAGQEVTCRVCGRPVRVRAAAAYVEAEAPSEVEALAAVPENMRECPVCCELIPRDVTLCPLCGEQVGLSLGTDELADLLRKRQRILEEYLRLPESAVEQDRLRGGAVAGRTIVALLGTAACGALVLWGSSARDGDIAIVVGVLLGFIFMISLLISLAHDYSANHIQTAAKPEKALSRWMLALQTGRSHKAYACLLPDVRRGVEVRTPLLVKLSQREERFRIEDPKSFERYWSAVLKSRGHYSRSMKLGRIHALRKKVGGWSTTACDVLFSGSPAWVALTILINPLVALILALAMTKKDEVELSKTLLHHDGRWWFAEPGWAGPYDTMQG